MFFISVDRSSNNPQFEAQAHRTQPQQFALVVLHQSQRFLFFIDLEGEKLEPLSWDLRIQIAIDVARALEYLHDGVHGPGADIDTLCVGPSYVKREEDFFFILHDILAEMEEVLNRNDSRCSCATFLVCWGGTLCFVDFSFIIKDLDIFDVSVLYNVDEPTVESQWSEGGRPFLSLCQILR
ncbi:Nuclear poly(A) polymerase 4 [Camellia lanceoleosa]|uniref:Nuclear poly(A) polymerase 4 n=1 Tax=Camellia lanceoleosa TaxID=1840588 RepID=A0ACC0ISC3_9ERIC|nr:Nuclear poly(A) polymerase 4 [Camellia lanceoleosa]